MKTINGNILDVTSGIIAHGVNRKLVMGAGVALAIARKYPEVKEQFLSRNNPIPGLGHVDLVPINHNLVICNCYTQDEYGRDKSIKYASLSSIIIAMTTLGSAVKDEEFIHIPFIGAGFGGLSWHQEVQPALLQIESDTNAEFKVYYL